ncbi:Co2+/Mg2+ efflux protein ApaG [Aurantiacibacter gangjinensis]|uniref:Magnesium transporter ApaG n=1 Tax=Aurantiacibacter gangjinensis TaxID=502682 RepID=A0A0G9MP88_9SPHN|nr:Co2+/Mg2+ efflux protein ApaG [Aurantiacibacter gangjinensis]APE28301.1 ApaG protein [Aurantiacibacter gangjinensis]KLE32541.1 magnesium transporter ApaG [Aurantiacibacter gangjinensis]
MTRAALNSLFQHVAITAGVTVRVSVNFMPEQSRVGAGRWFWVYHIRIENGRDERVQLKSRHWRITDSSGMVNVVDGEGVVGEMPVLQPGETHDYVSGCELTTNQGAMEGHYGFVHADGEPFQVAIPRFELAAPENSSV